MQYRNQTWFHHANLIKTEHGECASLGLSLCVRVLIIWCVTLPSLICDMHFCIALHFCVLLCVQWKYQLILGHMVWAVFLFHNSKNPVPIRWWRVTALQLFLLFLIYFEQFCSVLGANFKQNSKCFEAHIILQRVSALLGACLALEHRTHHEPADGNRKNRARLHTRVCIVAPHRQRSEQWRGVPATCCTHTSKTTIHAAWSIVHTNHAQGNTPTSIFTQGSRTPTHTPSCVEAPPHHLPMCHCTPTPCNSSGVMGGK